jgi:hypothetical protein
MSPEITKADNCIKIAINHFLFSPSFPERAAVAITIIYTVDELLLTEQQIMHFHASWYSTRTFLELYAL